MHERYLTFLQPDEVQIFIDITLLQNKKKKKCTIQDS